VLNADDSKYMSNSCNVMFVIVQIIWPGTVKHRKLGKGSLPKKKVIRGSNHSRMEASLSEKSQFQKVVEMLFPWNSTTFQSMG